jgi:predicted nucleic acid-binding protein
MTNELGLCLDLNIWCAALLADGKGRKGTASQTLVEFVRQGVCPIAPVRLIISWGMLNRLRWVLEEKLKVSSSAADLYVETISEYALLGPQLTLGGTGVIALADTEDAHVLETALAGKANVLVTGNFKDFLSNDTYVVTPEKHAIHIAPGHIVQIAHPSLMMSWIRLGQIPKPNLFLK